MPRSWRKRIPMIDYEKYGPHPFATCRPQDLMAYTHGIRRELGDRHIILYGGSFWNEPPYTGRVRGMFPDHRQGEDGRCERRGSGGGVAHPAQIMQAIKNLIVMRPALVVGLVLAALALVSAFGLVVSQEQVAAVVAFVGALATQSQVTPVKAPRLPSGTEITLEDPRAGKLGNVTLELQKE